MFALVDEHRTAVFDFDSNPRGAKKGQDPHTGGLAFLAKSMYFDTMNNSAAPMIHFSHDGMKMNQNTDAPIWLSHN